MAPRRKKGGNQAKEMERFRVGDLVLAKVKGFAAWPAKISRPEDWKRLPDPKKCFVRFFGTSEIGFVPPSNIKIFTIELKSELTGRSRIRQSKDFARAVDEICQAFEELQARKEELEFQQSGTEEVLESLTEMKLKKVQAHFEEPVTVRERKNQIQPSLSTVSPINNEKKAKLLEEEIVQIGEKKSFSEGTVENLNTSREDVGERKNQTHSSPSIVSPVSSEKKENLLEEEIDQMESKKSFFMEGTIDGSSASPEAVRERRNRTPSPSKVSAIGNEKRVILHKEEVVGIQGMECFPKDTTIEDQHTSMEDSKERDSPTPSSPSIVCPTSAEKRGKLLEEEIVGTRRNDSLSEGTIKDQNTSLESSRERKSPTPQPSSISPVDNEKTDGLHEEETVYDQIKDPHVSVETVRMNKSPDPHFSSVSSVINDKKGSVLEEENVQNQSKEKIVKEETLQNPNTFLEAVRESKSSSPPSLSVPPISDEKRECLLEVEVVQFQRKKRFSKEGAIDDHSTSPQVVRERITQTPLSPSTVSPVDNKNRENPVAEEIVQVRRKKRTSKSLIASPGTVIERKSPAPPSPPIVKEAIARTRRKKRFFSEETDKNQTTSPRTVRERKSPAPPPSTTLPVNNEKRENPLKEEITPIQRKKRIPASEMKTQASKRQRQENAAEQKTAKGVIKVLENQKADPPVSLSRKSLPHTRRRLRQIDDEEDEVKGANSDDNLTIKDHQSPVKSPINSEKTPEKYDRQRSSSSLDGHKSDKNTSNKEKPIVKGSTHSIADVRQKPKPSFSVNDKIREKLQMEDSSKGFDLLQESTDTSASYKSKFVDSSTSMKDLIAVAQAKRKETHSLGTLPPVFPLGRERSRSPVSIGPRSSPDNDGPVISLSTSVVSEKDERIALSGNEAVIAREAFEVMVETLSRTKESIGRATHQAIECAKFNMAGEIVDLLIRKLETEISFRRRIDLFFLVDSITQCSHTRKGIAGASYVSSVQASLTRLLNAAAPPGAAACENRHQCLKVLRLWLERKVLPESVLRPIIEDIEVPGVDQNSGLYLRRQCRSERSIDDPIREMDGMLVDEYGSNVAFQIPGLLSLHDSDEEEEEEDDLPRGPCENVSADVDNALEEQREVPKTPVKYQQCYLEVEKESEVEDREEREKSTVDDSPPLPANLPPSPPPLPSSPPPPPPPLPPQLLSSDPAPTPTPTPVMYTAAQYMAYPPMHQNHFIPPNGQNPFLMPGVNAGHQEAHLPPQGYHPMQFPFPQLPAQHPNLTQLPAQHLNLAQPPAQHPNLAQPPPPHPNLTQPLPQHLNLAQAPPQLPNVAQPPAQQPNLTQLPVQQPNLAQPPPQQPNLTQPPAQQHNLTQPPLQPINFQYPMQNPYFLPAANMTLQQMSEAQWASYAGWIPFSGVPLVNDGRFNSNLVAPVGSVQVPPAQGGPQIFPLNSWRPS